MFLQKQTTGNFSSAKKQASIKRYIIEVLLLRFSNVAAGEKIYIVNPIDEKCLYEIDYKRVYTKSLIKSTIKDTH